MTAEVIAYGRGQKRPLRRLIVVGVVVIACAGVLLMLMRPRILYWRIVLGFTASDQQMSELAPKLSVDDTVGLMNRNPEVAAILLRKRRFSDTDMLELAQRCEGGDIRRGQALCARLLWDWRWYNVRTTEWEGSAEQCGVRRAYRGLVQCTTNTGDLHVVVGSFLLSEGRDEVRDADLKGAVSAARLKALFDEEWNRIEVSVGR